MLSDVCHQSAHYESPPQKSSMNSGYEKLRLGHEKPPLAKFQVKVRREDTRILESRILEVQT